MNQYNHCTIKEREMILELLAKEYSIRSIAQAISRSPSTISRELKRNCNNGNYSPSEAQGKYSSRKKRCGRSKILSDHETRKTVQRLFVEYQWSPEQISNRLKLEETKINISHNTIYRAIYSGMLEEKKLSRGERGVVRKLRHRGKTRHTKDYEERRGKIQITNKIADRPDIISINTMTGDVNPSKSVSINIKNIIPKKQA